MIPACGLETGRFETCRQAMQFLGGRINYEGAAAGKLEARSFKLDRMQKLLSLIGDPHEDRPAVHVAGTKGKGSTSVMIAEMLAAAGLRVGLFTSPHIDAFEERMKVNGESPDPETLIELMNRLAAPIQQLDDEADSMRPTYFEIATALAWLYFRSRNTDIDVLEVGLGGRLDSTNLCRPVVTVITNISRDHTNILGETFAEIAAEKAGILKPGISLVTGVAKPAARDVVHGIATELGCEIDELSNDIQVQYNRDENGTATVDVKTPTAAHTAIPLTLAGKHQAANAALAVAAVDRLRAQGWAISDEAISRGMAAVRWPLRMERLGLSPTIIVDAAHNEESIDALCDALDDEFPAPRRILIFAASREKDIAAMARVVFPRFDEIVLTAFQGNPRSVSPEDLLATTQQFLKSPAHIAAIPIDALRIAQSLAASTDLICATGSFYLAAEIRNVVRTTTAINGDS